MYIDRHECTVHLSGLYSGSVYSAHSRKQRPVLDRQPTLVLNCCKILLKPFSLLLYSATSLPLCNGTVTGSQVAQDSLYYEYYLVHALVHRVGDVQYVCLCVCIDLKTSWVDVCTSECVYQSSTCLLYYIHWLYVLHM